MGRRPRGLDPPSRAQPRGGRGGGGQLLGHRDSFQDGQSQSGVGKSQVGLEKLHQNSARALSNFWNKYKGEPFLANSQSRCWIVVLDAVMEWNLPMRLLIRK